MSCALLPLQLWLIQTTHTEVDTWAAMALLGTSIVTCRAQLQGGGTSFVMCPFPTALTPVKAQKDVSDIICIWVWRLIIVILFNYWTFLGESWTYNVFLETDKALCFMVWFFFLFSAFQGLCLRFALEITPLLEERAQFAMCSWPQSASAEMLFGWDPG